MRLSGEVEVYRGDVLIDSGSNLVVTAGREYVASVFASGTAFSARYVQLGTGSTAASPSDIDLEFPVGSRVEGLAASFSATYRMESIFRANNPTTEEFITEAGLFTAESGGIMFARIVLGSPQVKPIDEELKIVWSIGVNA